MDTYYIVYDNYGNFYCKDLDTTVNFWEAAQPEDKKQLGIFIRKLSKIYSVKLLTMKVQEKWNEENAENN
jgi:hypothetical protein